MTGHSIVGLCLQTESIGKTRGCARNNRRQYNDACIKTQPYLVLAESCMGVFGTHKISRLDQIGREKPRI